MSFYSHTGSIVNWSFATLPENSLEITTSYGNYDGIIDFTPLQRTDYQEVSHIGRFSSPLQETLPGQYEEESDSEGESDSEEEEESESEEEESESEQEEESDSEQEEDEEEDEEENSGFVESDSELEDESEEEESSHRAMPRTSIHLRTLRGLQNPDRNIGTDRNDMNKLRRYSTCTYHRRKPRTTNMERDH